MWDVFMYVSACVYLCFCTSVGVCICVGTCVCIARVCSSAHIYTVHWLAQGESLQMPVIPITSQGLNEARWGLWATRQAELRPRVGPGGALRVS